jgi:putative acetyltransferase
VLLQFRQKRLGKSERFQIRLDCMGFFTLYQLMDSILTRQAVLQDASLLKNIHTRAVLGISSYDYSQEQLSAWTSDSLNSFQRLASTNPTVRVALFNGKIAGFSVQKENLQLWMLYVDPEYQGKGIGKVLLKEAEQIQYLKGLKIANIISSLSAKNFYVHNGYALGDNVEVIINGINIPSVKLFKKLKFS